MKQRGDNILIFSLKKVLLALATLWATQVLFYVANTRLFHIADFAECMGIVWGNVVFGLATVSALLLPYMLLMLVPTTLRWKPWYRFVAETLYVVPVVLMVVPNCCNAAYYQFTYRLLTAEIFSYLGISGQMGSLAPYFAVDFWYAWVFAIVIIVLFLLINSTLHLAPQRRFRQHIGADLTAAVVVAAIMVVFMRGGFGRTPLQLGYATHYCQPKNAALVGNDAYSIIRTIGKPDLEPAALMDRHEADAIFKPVYKPLPHHADSLAPTPRPNIVIIVLESFAQEYMGCYNGGALPSSTPFLDSLATASTVYQGRANGKKSIEGITAITSAVPNLMDKPFTQSPVGNSYATGLPSLLKPAGYYSAFLHGTYNGVMQFDEYCKRVGFDEYLGKNEYEADLHTGNNDYDGTWGIFDGPFLDYTVRRLGTYRQPFLAEVFTVTSHHPYHLPDDAQSTKADDRHPMLKCVAYTDSCLRRFFDQASRTSWFDSTLFIIVGDHSGPNITRNFNDYEGWYSIPLMVYRPWAPHGTISQRIVQQVDIMPTLLDLLRIDTTCTCFGTSLLRSPEVGSFVAYANGYYMLFANDGSRPAIHRHALLGGGRASGDEAQIATLKAIVQQFSNTFNH